MDPPSPGVIRGKLPGKQVPQLALVDGGTVRLLTRNGNDWTGRWPAVTKAISRLDVDDATAAGELVALDNDGISSFPALQAALSNGRDEVRAFCPGVA